MWERKKIYSCTSIDKRKLEIFENKNSYFATITRNNVRLTQASFELTDNIQRIKEYFMFKSITDLTNVLIPIKINGIEFYSMYEVSRHYFTIFAKKQGVTKITDDFKTINLVDIHFKNYDSDYLGEVYARHKEEKNYMQDLYAACEIAFDHFYKV